MAGLRHPGPQPSRMFAPRATPQCVTLVIIPAATNTDELRSMPVERDAAGACESFRQRSISAPEVAVPIPKHCLLSLLMKQSGFSALYNSSKTLAPTSGSPALSNPCAEEQALRRNFCTWPSWFIPVRA